MREKNAGMGNNVWGLRVGQVKPSNCFRRVEKLPVFPSIFDILLSSYSLHDVKR